MDASFNVHHAVVQPKRAAWVGDESNCLLIEEDGNPRASLFLHGTPAQFRRFCAELLAQLPQQEAIDSSFIRAYGAAHKLTEASDAL